MFIDVAKVSLKAGKGGDGAVSFRHEIYIPKGGPDGGDGGRGGSIIFKADKDTDSLIDFRFAPILTAANGKNGSGSRSAGRSGEDLIVEVPVGTVVYKLQNTINSDTTSSASPTNSTNYNSADSADSTNFGATDPADSTKPITSSASSAPERILIADLTYDTQTAVIAKGGDGGFGNAHFKSSTRQTPRVAEVGEPGEEFEAILELKSIADIGLVGLPNAGKSTFLSVVSNAKPEIADYPFTTITPNLGVATIDSHDLLIADIPGLIEGAADGKGLGHNFLRHVERTKVLLHLVDIYNDDAGEAYETIRKELSKYSDLSSRPEIVALTKCEGIDEDIIKMQMTSILSKNPSAKIFPISAQAHTGLTELLRELYTESSAESIVESSVEIPTYSGDSRVPTIKLNDSLLEDTWNIKKTDDKFIITGAKIEKFARRTDLNNYASINRLRDIMKKLGIRAELTSLGAEPTSIISIAGKEFTLVEDY